LNDQRLGRTPPADFPTPDATVSNRADAAEYIAVTTRALATQARGAGLTVLGLLLEKAAMTAGAEAITALTSNDKGSA
jgi:hypothetical protein